MNTILIIFLVILLAVGAFYITDRMGVPSPFNWLIKLFVGAIALYVLISNLVVLA